MIRDGSHQRDRVIVFCLYKKEAARVHNMLQWKGNYETVALHGDMSQVCETCEQTVYLFSLLPYPIISFWLCSLPSFVLQYSCSFVQVSK